MTQENYFDRNPALSDDYERGRAGSFRAMTSVTRWLRFCCEIG
jgi:hypothetical protein